MPGDSQNPSRCSPVWPALGGPALTEELGLAELLRSLQPQSFWDSVTLLCEVWQKSPVLSSNKLHRELKYIQTYYIYMHTFCLKSSRYL